MVGPIVADIPDPTAVGSAPTVHEAIPLVTVSVHGLPEKNVEPVPVMFTVPVGGADEAESLTVAVHVVA